MSALIIKQVMETFANGNRVMPKDALKRRFRWELIASPIGFTEQK